MFRPSERSLRVSLLIVAVSLVSLLSAPEARAQGSPAPDPAGLATGDRTSVTDASGTSFLVTEPTDPAAPDYRREEESLRRISRPRPQKEPLAMKLADSVGHVKIGTNTAWTLNTGYLVLFMQAGFALLTCGLVRQKNAGAPDDAELRRVRRSRSSPITPSASRSSSARSRSMPRRPTSAARRR